MLERLLYFTLGTMVGPVLRGIFRPVAVGAIKGGITISRAVEDLANEARAEVSEIHAEAVREVEKRPRRKRAQTA